MKNKIKLFKSAEKTGIPVGGQRGLPVFNAVLNLVPEVIPPKYTFSPLTRVLLGVYVPKKNSCSFYNLGYLETTFIQPLVKVNSRYLPHHLDIETIN